MKQPKTALWGRYINQHYNKTFILYLIIGGLVTAFGFLLLYVFVEFLHVDKNLAFFIQTIINLEILFILYNWLVWGHRKFSVKMKSITIRWVKFHLARALAVVLGQILFFILSFEIHYMVSNLIVVVIVTVLNYSANEKFVFIDEKGAY